MIGFHPMNEPSIVKKVRMDCTRVWSPARKMRKEEHNSSAQRPIVTTLKTRSCLLQTSCLLLSTSTPTSSSPAWHFSLRRCFTVSLALAWAQPPKPHPLPHSPTNPLYHSTPTIHPTPPHSTPLHPTPPNSSSPPLHPTPSHSTPRNSTPLHRSCFHRHRHQGQEGLPLHDGHGHRCT
jgi:hypothetical protein